MSKVTIQFNKNWRTPILKGGGVRSEVWATTTRLQNEANTNAGSSDFGKYVKMGDMGGGRWLGFVYAKNQKGQAAESESQALTRTMHG